MAVAKSRLQGLIFFLIFSLAASEALLRLQEPFFHAVKNRDSSDQVREIFFLYRRHPFWDHTLRSEIRRSFKDPFSGRECFYETDSHGFRHAGEVQMPKPPGVFRVFVLGDSFTEGMFCGPTVTQEIEKKLKNDYPGTRFEVINAGVSSLSVIPYTIRLRRQIFNLDPDLVVVNIDNTDVNDDLRLLSAAKFDKEGIPIEITRRGHALMVPSAANSQWLLNAARYSLLARLAWNLWYEKVQADYLHESDTRAYTGRGPAEIEVLQDSPWIKKAELSPEERKLFGEWQIFPEKLILLCRENKVPLILSSYPHPEQFVSEGKRNLQDFLRQLTTRLGVPYYDAHDDLVKTGSVEKFYLPEDVHFNPEGTRKWGEVLGEFVSKEVKNLVSSSQ